MKKKTRNVLLVALLACVVGIGAFWYCHPTHFAYNDRLVLGNTEAAIVERYGEFDATFLNTKEQLSKAYYMIRDNTPELFFGDIDNSLWYEIKFENGVAVRVDLREGWFGG